MDLVLLRVARMNAPEVLNTFKTVYRGQTLQ